MRAAPLPLATVMNQDYERGEAGLAEPFISVLSGSAATQLQNRSRTSTARGAETPGPKLLPLGGSGVVADSDSPVVHVFFQCKRHLVVKCDGCHRNMKGLIPASRVGSDSRSVEVNPVNKPPSAGAATFPSALRRRGNIWLQRCNFSCRYLLFFLPPVCWIQ